MDEKLMTTAEFAKFCGTSRSTLHWYDKIGLISPSVRGENGYRYYSVEQHTDFDTIYILQKSGSSLEEIHQIVTEPSIEDFLLMIEKNEVAIDRQLQEILSVKAFLENMQKMLADCTASSLWRPYVVTLPPLRMAATAIPRGEGFVHHLKRHNLEVHIRRLKDTPHVQIYPHCAILSAESLYSDEAEILYNFYEADEEYQGETMVRPGGQYIEVYHKGMYPNIRKAFDVILAFAQEHGYVLEGNVYKRDVITALLKEEEDWICKFQVKIKDPKAATADQDG